MGGDRLSSQCGVTCRWYLPLALQWSAQQLPSYTCLGSSQPCLVLAKQWQRATQTRPFQAPLTLHLLRLQPCSAGWCLKPAVCFCPSTALCSCLSDIPRGPLLSQLHSPPEPGVRPRKEEAASHSLATGYCKEPAVSLGPEQHAQQRWAPPDLHLLAQAAPVHTLICLGAPVQFCQCLSPWPHLPLGFSLSRTSALVTKAHDYPGRRGNVGCA